jgi:hypothetical protein
MEKDTAGCRALNLNYYCRRVTNDKEKNCIEKALNKAINSKKTENRK